MIDYENMHKETSGCVRYYLDKNLDLARKHMDDNVQDKESFDRFIYCCSVLESILCFIDNLNFLYQND